MYDDLCFTNKQETPYKTTDDTSVTFGYTNNKQTNERTKKKTETDNN